MNPKLASLLLVGTILWGCSGDSSTEDLAGGGFETSDLHALVVDSAGNPLVGARVWIVSSSDSSVTATAHDSSITGSSGLVSLHPGTLDKIGLEAWSGDTLAGFALNIDRNSRDTIRLLATPTRAVFLPCSSFSKGAFQAPGSHFSQVPPPVCTDSFPVLVPGKGVGKMTWISDSLKIEVPFDWDTLPVWRGQPGGPDPHGNGNGPPATPPGQLPGGGS